MGSDIVIGKLRLKIYHEYPTGSFGGIDQGLEKINHEEIKNTEVFINTLNPASLHREGEGNFRLIVQGKKYIFYPRKPIISRYQ